MCYDMRATTDWPRAQTEATTGKHYSGNLNLDGEGLMYS